MGYELTKVTVTLVMDYTIDGIPGHHVSSYDFEPVGFLHNEKKDVEVEAGEFKTGPTTVSISGCLKEPTK